MFRVLNNVSINDYIVADREGTTINSFKLISKAFKSEEANYFFFNRTVNVWKSLPAHTVNSNTVETFKIKLE